MAFVLFSAATSSRGRRAASSDTPFRHRTGGISAQCPRSEGPGARVWSNSCDSPAWPVARALQLVDEQHVLREGGSIVHQSESGNLTIKWNHLDASPALETKIRERFEKLRTRCPSITGGRVTIAPVEKHHRDGNRYQVSIHVSLPGETVIVEHQPRQQPASRLGLSDKRHKSEEITAATRIRWWPSAMRSKWRVGAWSITSGVIARCARPSPAPPERVFRPGQSSGASRHTVAGAAGTGWSGPPLVFIRPLSGRPNEVWQTMRGDSRVFPPGRGARSRARLRCVVAPRWPARKACLTRTIFSWSETSTLPRAPRVPGRTGAHAAARRGRRTRHSR